jgi:hypothetical protein
MESMSLSKDKVTDLLGIFKESIKKVTEDLSKITNTATLLVGPDGKPTRETMESVRLKICGILKEKTACPTILEHLNNQELHTMHDIGASFKVAHILGMSVTGVLIKVLPGLDPEAATAMTYMALVEIADPKAESLFHSINEFLKIDKRDEQGNVILFPDDDKKQLVTLAVTVMIRSLLANELLEKVDDTSVQITETGLGVINHLAAVDAIINIIEHSQIHNAADLSKKDNSSVD